MGVDLGGGDRAMTEQRLDIPYVHPRFKQRCSERVAKHMRGNVACQPDALKVLMYDTPDGLRGQGPAAPINKDRTLK